MSKIADQYIRKYANILAEEGERMIRRAFSSATFNKNKTQNLHDSYGSCVFYNGKEVPNTRRYVGRKAVVGKKDPQGNLILGRAEIDEFFNNYKTQSKGFELITAAAIFYASILEKGKGRLKRKYRVLSGLNTAMNQLATETKGKVIDINM